MLRLGSQVQYGTTCPAGLRVGPNAVKKGKPSSAENSANNSAKPRRGNPEKIRQFQFQPGQSGNPGGRPKSDQAAALARTIFENNSDAIYKAMLKAIKKGSPKVFNALADRGYGKVPQRLALEGTPEAPIGFKVNIKFIDPPDPRK